MLCPTCRKDLPDSAKFCSQCGHKLSAAAPGGETHGPDEAAAAALAGERRSATVVFSDMTGFTPMTERLDPEEVQGLMSRVKARADEIAARYEGVVNQFVGDEVVTLFGIPVAHEDDAVRAVRAAQELHAAVRALSVEVADRIGQPLAMHTGINTGLIVVQSADGRDGTYSLTGDTVNTCARLAAMAGPDEILLAPETQRGVAPFFKTEALAAVALKGKALQITPYRVIGGGLARSRFEAAEQRGLTRYVGRERELRTLQESLAEAVQGRGQALTLVGEAGMGKSRLLHEFRRALVPGSLNLVFGRCSVQGRNHPYLPFLDMMRTWFGISDTDGPADLTGKITAGARALDPALDAHLATLLHLFAVPGQGLPAATSPDVVQRKIREAMLACLAAGAKSRPLLLVAEDLHWVDPASEDVLRHYIQALPALRVLLLLSYRPEHRPAWGEHAHLKTLRLTPLALENTRAVVASALGADSVPEDLAQAIHAKTDGNPFFTEEISFTLSEEGVVRVENGKLALMQPAAHLRLPDTVQSVIRSRIDRLDDAKRELLRLASVVGREFTENLVARLSASGTPVPMHLAGLKQLEMILEKHQEPELRFMFKHAITHEVAYQSLLVRRRKILHKLVGLGIEELYAERLGEFYEMLAHHFAEGAVWDKAVHYLVKAGTRARQHWAIGVAQAHLERAAAILERPGVAVPWEDRADLLYQHGLVIASLGQAAKAFDMLESAVHLVRQHGSRERLIPLLIDHIPVASFAQRPADMYRYAEELESLAEGDPDLLLAAAAMKWASRLFFDDLERTFVEEERARELMARRPNSPFIPFFALNLGASYRWRGECRACTDLLAPMLPVAKEVVPFSYYLHMVFFHGLALGEQGRFGEAIATLTVGRAQAVEAGEKYTIPKLDNCLAWVHRELCLLDDAMRLNTAALDAIMAMFGPGVTHLFEVESQTRIDLAENCLLAARPDDALQHLEIVIENAKSPDYAFVRGHWLARCLLALGEAWLAKGDPTRAESFLARLEPQGWTRRFPFRKYQVRAARLRGAILQAQGRAAEAEAPLREALAGAQALGNPSELWRSEQVLGAWHERAGRVGEARQHYRSAFATVERIAAGLKDSGLRARFLAAAPVQGLAGQAEGVA